MFPIPSHGAGIIVGRADQCDAEIVGTFVVFQVASLNVVAWAPVTFPDWTFQPSSDTHLNAAFQIFCF